MKSHPWINFVVKAELRNMFWDQLLSRILMYFNSEPNIFHSCVFCKGHVKDFKVMWVTISMKDPESVDPKIVILPSHVFCYTLNKIGLRHDTILEYEI